MRDSRFYIFFEDVFIRLRHLRFPHIRNFAVHLVTATLGAVMLASAFILADMYFDIIPDQTEPPATLQPVIPEQSTTQPPDTEPQITETEPSTSALPVFDPGERADCILKETEDAGQEYIDSLIFLGDSRTYGLKAYKMLSGGKSTEQVWVPDSGTLQVCDAYSTYISLPDGSDVKLKELLETKKPKILVISLGINYVNYAKAQRTDEEDFKFWYSKLLDTVIAASPETTVIIQSIYPINETVYKTYDNATLIERNDWLLDLAYDYGMYYLNTAEALADDDGNLNLKYQNGDGCHPGYEGYSEILKYIRTHALPGFAAETTDTTDVSSSSTQDVSVTPPVTENAEGTDIVTAPAETISPSPVDPPSPPAENTVTKETEVSYDDSFETTSAVTQDDCTDETTQSTDTETSQADTVDVTFENIE